MPQPSSRTEGELEVVAHTGFEGDASHEAKLGDIFQMTAVESS